MGDKNPKQKTRQSAQKTDKNAKAKPKGQPPAAAAPAPSKGAKKN